MRPYVSYVDMKQQLREEIAPLLLPTFLEISAAWRHCVPQQRSYLRALRRGWGGLVCLGRRTLARIIWTNGGEQRSGSGEYFLHWRCRWRPQQLFDPTGVSSTRSALAAVSRQSDAGAAVCASVAVGSVASASSDQRPRPAAALRVLGRFGRDRHSCRSLGATCRART